MKAIKFKVHLSPAQIKAYDILRLDLSRVWNEIHRVAIHNRSIEWWKWAERHEKKKPWEDENIAPWTIEGCTKTAIELPRKHAYIGASCPIARDNRHWEKDESAKPIQYRQLLNDKTFAKAKKSEVFYEEGRAYRLAYKFPQRLTTKTRLSRVDISNRPFEFMRLPSISGGGKEFTAYSQLQNLNHLRAFGINLPPGVSTFLGGVFAQFEEAYKSWVDVKRKHAHKPRYRKLDRPEEWVPSLYSTRMSPSRTYGCTAAPLDFIRRESGDHIAVNSIFGEIQLYEGEFDRVPANMIPRTFSILHDASGYYVSVVFATRAEVAVVLASSQSKRAGKDAPESVKDSLKLAVEAAKQVVKEENHNPGNGKTLGIDPGVIRHIAACDGTKFFHLKLSRRRDRSNKKLDDRIGRLQSKLSKIKSANNRRLGQDPDLRRSAGEIRISDETIILKNEAKLAHQIARLQLLRKNRRKAYQHRVAVRLFQKGYSTIKYEKTDVKGLMQSEPPDLGSDGQYRKNKAGRKRRLDRSIANAGMASQSEKIKARFVAAGRTFVGVAPEGTSTNCHCCSQKGQLGRDRIFRCLNAKCGLFKKPQDRDYNAAGNMLRGPAGEEQNEAG